MNTTQILTWTSDQLHRLSHVDGIRVIFCFTTSKIEIHQIFLLRIKFNYIPFNRCIRISSDQKFSYTMNDILFHRVILIFLHA